MCLSSLTIPICGRFPVSEAPRNPGNVTTRELGASKTCNLWSLENPWEMKLLTPLFPYGVSSPSPFRSQPQPHKAGSSWSGYQVKGVRRKEREGLRCGLCNAVE